MVCVSVAAGSDGRVRALPVGEGGGVRVQDPAPAVGPRLPGCRLEPLQPGLDGPPPRNGAEQEGKRYVKPSHICQVYHNNYRFSKSQIMFVISLLVGGAGAAEAGRQV